MEHSVTEKTTKQEILQERYKRRMTNYLNHLKEKTNKNIPQEILIKFYDKLEKKAKGHIEQYLKCFCTKLGYGYIHENDQLQCGKTFENGEMMEKQKCTRNHHIFPRRTYFERVLLGTFTLDHE